MHPESPDEMHPFSAEGRRNGPELIDDCKERGVLSQLRG